MSISVRKAWRNFIIATLLLLTACTTTDWHRVSVDSTSAKKKYDNYFYDYDSLVESLLAKRAYSAEECYIVGEYFFLKGDFHIAEKYLFSAMESPDDTTALASFALFRDLFASHSLAYGMAHLVPHSINPIVLRHLLADGAAWAVALGDTKQAAHQLQHLHPMQKFALSKEPYLHGFSDFSPLSRTEQAYRSNKPIPLDAKKVEIPDYASDVVLKNYTKPLAGDIYYLQSDFLVDSREESTFSLFVETGSWFRLYLDGKVVLEKSEQKKVVEPYASVAIAPGRHTLLLKIMTRPNLSSDISVLLVDAKKKSLSVKWRIPKLSPKKLAFSQKKLLMPHKQNSDVFQQYLNLVGKSLENNGVLQREWIAFYSRVVGSDNPALLWRLAEAYLADTHSQSAQELLQTTVGKYPAFDYIRMRYADILYDDDSSDGVALLVLPHMKNSTLPALILNADYARTKGWNLRYSTIVRQMQKEFPTYIISALYDADDAALRGNKELQRTVRHDVLSLYPGYRPVADELLEQVQESGDLRAVIALTKQLLNLYPDNQGYLSAQADALYAMRRYDDAKKLYQHIVELNGSSYNSLIRLGDIAIHAGLKEKAFHWYTLARSLAPAKFEVSNKLEQCDNDVPVARFTNYLLSDQEVNSLKHDSLEEECNEDIQIILDEGVELFSKTSSYHAVYRMILRVMTREGARKLSLRAHSGKLLSATLTKSDGTHSTQWQKGVSSLLFGHLTIGDVIEYTVEDYAMPQYWIEGMNMEWYFGQTGRCATKSRLTIQSPEELPLHVHLEGNIKKQEIKTADGMKATVFEVNNSHFAASDSALLIPLLSISSVPSWDTVARQAFQFIRKASPISDKVAEQAKELHGKGGIEQFVARAYRFVFKTIFLEHNSADTLRTVPYSANRVLKSGKGDSTDKANLFKSLLKAEGVRSFFVLTKGAEDGAVFRDTPAMQFTHTLILIPKQKGIAKELFVDFSLKNGELGVVAEGVNGKEGFLLNDYNGAWSFVEIHALQKEGVSRDKNGLSEDVQP